TQLQRSVGEHFASAQGGIFTSPEVAEAITGEARQKSAHFDHLSFVTASARNSGGDVFVDQS
ncbi:MAG: hypothetical protein CG438_1496, partial [Methylococcaceae bacterium NSP1-1]